MYINRNIEKTINQISDKYKVLLVTGPRQVGKTTVLKHLMTNSNRTYVTLDDLMVRNLAITDPTLFLQKYSPPILVDEIQYAPQLLNYIKMYVDAQDRNGTVWLTSSVTLSSIKSVTENLGDRVGVLTLCGLELSEIVNTTDSGCFSPKFEHLLFRSKAANRYSLKEIYKIIWQGSMPSIYNDSYNEWQSYYASYVQNLLQYDVMKQLQVNDEMIFFTFLRAAAGQTGRIINYAELAKAAEISAPTAKQWVKILEDIGIIYMLQPFMPPGSKYVVKAPKLYFCDTGLAAYLTSWNNADALESGAMSEEFLSTWVVMEIYKSYSNKGKIPPIYYLRNFNGKEINLIIYEDGIAYPIMIKKASSPNKIIKTFAILDPVAKDAKLTVGEGGIICFSDEVVPAAENINYIPVWMV